MNTGHCAGCRCFEGRAYTKPCEHCYCTGETQTAGRAALMICCKCGDRRAVPVNRTLSLT